MNKQSRTAAINILERLEVIEVELETLASDEQEKFDNLSEGLQESERGQALEEAANGLEEARGQVEEAVGSLQQAIATLNELS